jgi:hypothetical protein
MTNPNKNMSKSYRETYCQESDPSMGAKVPAGKDSKDNLDSQKNPNLDFQKVRDAEEIPGAARKALDQQTGRGTKTGGSIGDDAAHPNSGCDDRDE